MSDDLKKLVAWTEAWPTITRVVLRAFTNEIRRRHFDQHGKPQPQYSYMDIALFLLKELGIKDE